jgi:hypothetical protein
MNIILGNKMRAIEKTKVPYTVLNIKRCRCTLCPIQADSECAQEKYSRLENELESPGGVEALEPQKVPGVYCSAGTATCSDLNFNRQCLCNTCPVWEEYKLEKSTPMAYFCNKGRAT